MKVFLLALAIVDDMGAILVIAIFYSEGVSFGWLLFAVAMVVIAAAIRRRVDYIRVYVLLGVLCWFGLHEAHVHPTLAGVAFGLLTPMLPRRSHRDIETTPFEADPTAERAYRVVRSTRLSVSTVEWLEFRLHPYTAWLIVPIFALANAGVKVPASEFGDAMSSSVTWGVILGLVVGKTVGVAGAVGIAVATGLGRLPAGVNTRYVIGAGALAGIGFTVSLFVSELAFGERLAGRVARLGVLIASLVAAAVGAAITIPGRVPQEEHERVAVPG
jgi:NhaA family Na+:H+ antiporter